MSRKKEENDPLLGKIYTSRKKRKRMNEFSATK